MIGIRIILKSTCHALSSFSIFNGKPKKNLLKTLLNLFGMRLLPEYPTHKAIFRKSHRKMDRLSFSFFTKKLDHFYNVVNLITPSSCPIFKR